MTTSKRNDANFLTNYEIITTIELERKELAQTEASVGTAEFILNVRKRYLVKLRMDLADLEAEAAERGIEL